MEEVAEDRGAELEGLVNRESRAPDVGIRLMPGAGVVFRPEEVDGGSERGAGAPVVGRALADPDHQARRGGLGAG